jgi:hypothetical protein
MSPTEPVSNIADASRPNAGRIYDYLLGGNHNFEVDRQAVQRLLQVMPDMPKWTRLIRWFLGEAVRRLLDEGFTYFLDFASGLPTVDHIHQISPKGTKVIYSDIDPVTVAYAQELIKGNPNVAFVECDVCKPELLLNSGIIEKIFKTQRKVAIGLNGIAWFLSDDSLTHTLKVLYDWAAPGSRLFLCDMDAKSETGATKGIADFYQSVGASVFHRHIESLNTLMGQWHLTGKGFRPLTEWLGVDRKEVAASIEQGGGTNIFGAILAK